MDASRTRTRPLFAAATLLFISSLILLPLVSVPIHAAYNQRNMILGSRPPRCNNKCNACKPCSPTLVAQRQHRVKKTSPSSRDNDDDGYYLLSWKCRCGDKLFQP